jgi:2'-hydroxyisoflavone reductase
VEILVIGGTLFIGRILVKELVRKGHSVTVLHRKPEHDLGPGVASLRADRNDAGSLQWALAKRSFDVVFDNVYDWERGTTAAQIEATVQACGWAKLSRYIFMSSVAAYGEGSGCREEDPLAPADHPDSYVRNKANSERLLFRMHEQHGLPVVTLRPPFIYGPGNPYYREAFFWDRIRDRRPVIIPDNGDRLMQFIYVDDLVSCAVNTMENQAAIGQAFNVANPMPISQLELVNALALAAEAAAPELVKIPREKLIKAGGHPRGPKYYFAQYFDLPPITQGVEKAQRILKFAPMDFAEGLRKTYRWYVDARPFAPPDYSFEDEMIAEARS